MQSVTREYLSQNVTMSHSDPEKFLALAEVFVLRNPDEPDGYYYRHLALSELGRHAEALADIDTVLVRDKHWLNFEVKGNLLRKMGRYQEALGAYNRAQAADPEDWGGGFGWLFRAECHARLGDEAAALADWAHLPDEHWTPGLLGAPKGNKE
jgi:tetratricopeptide (TPR) repeat protein